jgi:hypothetical protein
MLVVCDLRMGCVEPHAIKVVYEVGYTDEGKDMHINLSHNTLLHRLVVQVRHIRRIDCDVLFGNAVICLSHDGNLRSERNKFDEIVLRRTTTTSWKTTSTLKYDAISLEINV